MAEAVERGLLDPQHLPGLPTAQEAVDMLREPSPEGTRPATDALAELRAEDSER